MKQGGLAPWAPRAPSPLQERSLATTAMSRSALWAACAAAVVAGSLIACAANGSAKSAGNGKQGGNQAVDEKIKIATFAGGCFWCMEPPFDKVDGVISTISGYTGGLTPTGAKDPTATRDRASWDSRPVSVQPFSAAAIS